MISTAHIPEVNTTFKNIRKGKEETEGWLSVEEVDVIACSVLLKQNWIAMHYSEKIDLCSILINIIKYILYMWRNKG